MTLRIRDEMKKKTCIISNNFFYAICFNFIENRNTSIIYSAQFVIFFDKFVITNLPHTEHQFPGNNCNWCGIFDCNTRSLLIIKRDSIKSKFQICANVYFWPPSAHLLSVGSFWNSNFAVLHSVSSREGSNFENAHATRASFFLFSSCVYIVALGNFRRFLVLLVLAHPQRERDRPHLFIHK